MCFLNVKWVISDWVLKFDSTGFCIVRMEKLLEAKDIYIVLWNLWRREKVVDCNFILNFWEMYKHIEAWSM